MSTGEQGILSSPSSGKRDSLTDLSPSDQIDSYRVWLKSRRDLLSAIEFLAFRALHMVDTDAVYIGAREDTSEHMPLLALLLQEFAKVLCATTRVHRRDVDPRDLSARFLLLCKICSSPDPLYFPSTLRETLRAIPLHLSASSSRYRPDFSTFPRRR